MPAVNPSILIDAVIDAIQQSGGNGILVPGEKSPHPRKFIISYNNQTFSLWVYIWTLTHGGRPSLPREYRIQMTSVSSPLLINPDGYTCLLGYFSDLDMFAGFDIERHKQFTTGSPSIQISIDTIHSALQYGLSFSTKTNTEIAIGIRPDQLINYVLNSLALHKFGEDAKIIPTLIKASQSEPITPEEISEATAERQVIISQISRYARSASFRQQVLNAYDNRCALTRMQLKLVDAAHILPVTEKGSIDDVTNGISLSPTMHRAFDHGLIYLDEEYKMRLNEARYEGLKQLNLIAGVDQLQSLLDSVIHLPADNKQYPKKDYILEANKYRRIPGF